MFLLVFKGMNFLCFWMHVFVTSALASLLKRVALFIFTLWTSYQFIIGPNRYTKINIHKSSNLAECLPKSKDMRVVFYCGSNKQWPILKWTSSYVICHIWLLQRHLKQRLWDVFQSQQVAIMCTSRYKVTSYNWECCIYFDKLVQCLIPTVADDLKSLQHGLSNPREQTGVECTVEVDIKSLFIWESV